MKELPKVYVNPIDKDLRNNKNFFYSSSLEEKKDDQEIAREIDHIFHSKDFVYKKKVELTLENEVIETNIVGKKGSSLITMDGQTIPFSKIKKIKKLNE